ncbi:MAG TPA: hypothetical protein VK548_15860 [Candidatus Acidoferrum sp.]|nr:hypothetical protein [Candidatus Acidoferrum sp.]
MTAHPLAGYASVDASARRIGHYRWLEERLLRILGGWIALTPELPVKLLFGRHVWDCAQHADLWGRRLPELRARAQGEPPSEGFAHLVELVEGLQARHESIARVVSVYRVLKPHLVAAYRTHLDEANPVYEPPTRRILLRCLEEERRHVAAGAVILERLRASNLALADEWERRLLEELGRVEGLAGARDRVGRDAAPPDPRADLVALDSVFDPAVIDRDLAAALDAHRRAVVDGDLGTVAGQTIGPARDAVRDLYRVVGQTVEASVVACARVGAYRFVKLALRGPRAISVVQLEWRRGDAGWRIVGAELVRSEPAG